MILLYDLVFHAIQLLNMTDVLIICALRDEYNALLKTLGGETSWKERRSLMDGLLLKQR